MKSSEFYDKYAPLIYGSIFRLTLNEPIADKVFFESFIGIYDNSVNSKKSGSAIPCLLRSVYSTTLQKLKQSGLKPVEDIPGKESCLLDLLCNKVISLQEAATIIGISEMEARRKLRHEVFQFRAKAIY